MQDQTTCTIIRSCDPQSVPIRFTIIIPFYDRVKDAEEAVEAWRLQKYSPAPVICIASDYGGCSKGLRVKFAGDNEESKRVVFTHTNKDYWNINAVRNNAFLNTVSDIVVFAPSDVKPISDNILKDISLKYNEVDAWLIEGCHDLGSGVVPHDTSLDGLIVVKRWVHYATAGFMTDMFSKSRGWGYDNIDYVIRMNMLLKQKGGVVATLDSSLFSARPNTPQERAAPYVANRCASFATTTSLSETWNINKTFSDNQIAKHGYRGRF